MQVLRAGWTSAVEGRKQPIYAPQNISFLRYGLAMVGVDALLVVNVLLLGMYACSVEQLSFEHLRHFLLS